MKLKIDNKFSLGSRGTLVRISTRDSYGKIVIRKFDHKAFSFPYVNHMEFDVKVTTR